ncbi:hypothetical protein HZS_3093 [Henneguya salminicola]|nr:hypothetical protein HZS_3093 [Henneguya salminicola]
MSDIGSDSQAKPVDKLPRIEIKTIIHSIIDFLVEWCCYLVVELIIAQYVEILLWTYVLNVKPIV